MAYWQRDRGLIYVFTRVSGKPKKLPRRETRQLDALEDDKIDLWVQQWEEQYEGKKIQADNIAFSDGRLMGYVNQYLGYMASRKKSVCTIKQHESMLTRFGLPYFLRQDPPLKDPHQWPAVSIKMLETLQAKGVSPGVIFRVNVALRNFFNYLQEEGLVNSSLKLQLRPPLQLTKETPLKFQLMPADVLRFASNKSVAIDVRFMGLVGYFMSLRPQEVFALQRNDFRAGSPVVALDCAKAMKRANLYNRLAVNVTRQRTATNTMATPKTGSKGWVSCFDETAAQELVNILRVELTGIDKEERILPYNNGEQYRRWGRHGIKGVTLKDLRRASLYYLGHFTELTPVELMKHARHQRLETTMIYLRRPEENLVEADDLDLEA